MQFELRRYHPSDLPALCRICLQTGAGGHDASALYRDPDLLGQYFAAPYLCFEPALCQVLTCDRQPVGYVLGTRDSAGFSAWCEREWFPVLRQRHPVPDAADRSVGAWVIRLMHAGIRPAEGLAAYPAHLHIDILQVGQGLGWGRALMAAFERQLRDDGVAGMHLKVGKDNGRAIGFYAHLGFEPLGQTEKTLVFGRRLAA
jgi:GNAT superfamily N-acetyltransferase